MLLYTFPSTNSNTKSEGGVAHSDIVCGPCAALRSEKPATLAMAEFSLSYEERLPLKTAEVPVLPSTGGWR